MNHQLTNEQVARVFAMYYGATLIEFVDPQRNRLRLDEINKGVASLANEALLKLELTPLSAISDEDAIEVAKIAKCKTHYYPSGNVRPIEDVIRDGKAVVNSLVSGNRTFCYELYLYLIQQSYAVPLFIAPNHPDNSKTAIELGLAIDKKEAVCE